MLFYELYYFCTTFKGRYLVNDGRYCAVIQYFANIVPIYDRTKWHRFPKIKCLV